MKIPKMMKAMVLEKQGQPLEHHEVPVPEPGPDQVLLRVHACGVCRTDLHIVDGDLTEPKLPLILGHQIVGTVVQIGDQVDQFQAGDRVGVPWLGYTDNTCRYCRRGQENLCENPKFTGYTMDGGFAEYTVAYQQYSFHLPESYDDVDVAPLELSGWQVTPGATFGASTDESSLDVNGRLAARARRGDLSIQGSLRGGLTGIGEPVVRENEKATLTASYSGIEALRPSLSYSIDRQVAVYKGERQEAIGHSLSGRMTWAPGAVHHEELSFTLTSKGPSEDRQIAATFENVYRLDLQAWMGGWRSEAAYPALDLRVETDVSYRLTGDQPDIDATTTGRLNAAFSPTWSGSLGVSYLGGTDSAGEIYSSLLLDLTFAIDF